MDEQLGLLVNLQAVDGTIHRLETSRADLDSGIEKLRDYFNREAEDFNRLNQELEANRKELRSRERKLQLTEDNLVHYEQKIYSVKSQKEMKAVDHEIKAAREEKEKLEESILYLLEAIDELSVKVTAEEEKLNQAKAKLKQEEENYKERLAWFNQSLESNKEKREEVLGRIRPENLSLYERLQTNRSNLAVVSIHGGACGGCFMTLPPQVVNEVKANSSILRCQSCTRILYWDENKEQVISNQVIGDR